MPGTIREAVAVFDDVETLDTAVYALETRGFDRAAFSLLAGEKQWSRSLATGIGRLKTSKTIRLCRGKHSFPGFRGLRPITCPLRPSRRSAPWL